MEGVTIVFSFMFSFGHVGALLILTCISLALTLILAKYSDYILYSLAAFVVTIILLPILLFATMNLNIPWQHVTIDETVTVEEFMENYKILDIEDGIYFVRPLDN